MSKGGSNKRHHICKDNRGIVMRNMLKWGWGVDCKVYASFCKVRGSSKNSLGTRASSAYLLVSAVQASLKKQFASNLAWFEYALLINTVFNSKGETT